MKRPRLHDFDMVVLGTIAIALLFLVIGCGTQKYDVRDGGIYERPPEFKPSGSIDAEMAEYVNEFKAEASSRKIDLGYSDLMAVSWVEKLYDGDQPLWGQCQIYSQPNRPMVSEIRLSIGLNRLPASVKKLIIFHELGHCLYGLQHTSEDPDNLLQIMYPSSGDAQINNAEEYAQPYAWARYLDFLFFRKDLEVFQ